MKRLILAFLCAGLVAFAVTGCKDGGSQGDGAEPEGRPAISFQDGAKNYDDYQFICPVCGKEGLKQELHVDTEQGRVYFDKKECMETFKEDQEKYLQQYEQMKRQPSGGGSRGQGGGGGGSS